VEFALKYRGPLPAASSSNKRVAEKHQIRRYLHSQLAQFWQKDPRFSKIDPANLQLAEQRNGRFDVPRPIGGNPASWFYHLPLRGIKFVPLITHVREAHCHLAIRFYRRDKPGEIISTDGDLDNRLKTLFDALRMPHRDDELPKDIPLGESPFFCLLDDDALITKLSIETFALLTPTQPGDDDAYAELEMGVEIRAMTPMWGTIDWLFG
jgi:hypothetical protein